MRINKTLLVKYHDREVGILAAMENVRAILELFDLIVKRSKIKVERYVRTEDIC